MLYKLNAFIYRRLKKSNDNHRQLLRPPKLVNVVSIAFPSPSERVVKTKDKVNFTDTLGVGYRLYMSA